METSNVQLYVKDLINFFIETPSFFSEPFDTEECKQMFYSNIRSTAQKNFKKCGDPMLTEEQLVKALTDMELKQMNLIMDGMMKDGIIEKDENGNYSLKK
jgi:hypothetical protein